ncbi:MAG: gamma-glutamyltransferase [Pseudonocardiales bacterium]|nr:gamma-glutamyltransferase [Pseudonocardiales bacterium]
MSRTPAHGGIAVAPHALASASALAVLRNGGNAIEATVAAAATIAVVYPHMNSLGGDGFWLISVPGSAPVGIDACGAAAGRATIDAYLADGFDAIPYRGPRAANTVAGTISGWQAALELSASRLGNRLPLERLLADAIEHAEQGFPVTVGQQAVTAHKQPELIPVSGFAETFLPGGMPPVAGQRFTQPALGNTLRRLAAAGLDDFYRGELGCSIARQLAAAGSPLELADLQRHRAVVTRPLTLAHSGGRVSNLRPPTQGLVSLLILGIIDRLLEPTVDPLGAPFVHACVEATKLAFEIRDRVITDPAYLTVDTDALLASSNLDALAARVDPQVALPWSGGKSPADTVWLGAIDSSGVAVSFIQSTYHEFGSGVVLDESGITWQNRGCSFSLDRHGLNPLMPGRKPFHTLNPGLAEFDDGRTLVYGSMGGDGQPQSLSAVFSRIHRSGMDPQAAVDAPRWLLGRTWGEDTDTLKLENRFPEPTISELRRLGHDVEIMSAYDETMGHAGALLRHSDGRLEGGFDPRSDGAVGTLI